MNIFEIDLPKTEYIYTMTEYFLVGNSGGLPSTSPAETHREILENGEPVARIIEDLDEARFSVEMKLDEVWFPLEWSNSGVPVYWRTPSDAFEDIKNMFERLDTKEPWFAPSSLTQVANSATT